jgi:hypothetical protein
MHTGTGWLAAVIRPGNLRFGIGPTWGATSASGTGVHPDFDIGQDLDQFPQDAIRYQGYALHAGGQLTAGYTVLDLDPMAGLVEVMGSFASDGARNYMAFGLRVGIVPFIERQKE